MKSTLLKIWNSERWTEFSKQLGEWVIHKIFSGLLRRDQSDCPCINCLRDHYQARMFELVAEAKPKVEAAIDKLHGAER